MQFINTSSRYGAVSQSIHWLTAALVVVLLVSGKAGDIEAEEANALYFWHSSLGLTILLLVAARIVWRFVSPPPKLPATMSSLSRSTAAALHVLFYALLVALPLSGWFAASAEGASVTFFGMTTLPLAGGAPLGEEFWEETHEVLGNVLLIVASLHVLAALKHHFVDKDDVFRRMLPGGKRSSTARPS